MPMGCCFFLETCVSVYLPTSSQKDIDFLEYFIGDFNEYLDNSLGEKSAREPNQRGLKLLEMADHFGLI